MHRLSTVDDDDARGPPTGLPGRTGLLRELQMHIPRLHSLHPLLWRRHPPFPEIASGTRHAGNDEELSEVILFVVMYLVLVFVFVMGQHFGQVIDDSFIVVFYDLSMFSDSDSLHYKDCLLIVFLIFLREVKRQHKCTLCKGHFPNLTRHLVGTENIPYDEVQKYLPFKLRPRRTSQTKTSAKASAKKPVPIPVKKSMSKKGKSSPRETLKVKISGKKRKRISKPELSSEEEAEDWHPDDDEDDDIGVMEHDDVDDVPLEEIEDPLVLAGK